MDIQRTRTVSETGTGRQFDTRQRHVITAVVDKTQVFFLLSLDIKNLPTLPQNVSYCRGFI